MSVHINVSFLLVCPWIHSLFLVLWPLDSPSTYQRFRSYAEPLPERRQICSDVPWTRECWALSTRDLPLSPDPVGEGPCTHKDKHTPVYRWLFFAKKVHGVFPTWHTLGYEFILKSELNRSKNYIKKKKKFQNPCSEINPLRHLTPVHICTTSHRRESINVNFFESWSFPFLKQKSRNKTTMAFLWWKISINC